MNLCQADRLIELVMVAPPPLENFAEDARQEHEHNYWRWYHEMSGLLREIRTGEAPKVFPDHRPHAREVYCESCANTARVVALRKAVLKAWDVLHDA